MSFLGGGEILRGVMQKNCIWSRPAFYTLMGISNFSGAATQITQQMQLQCHADRYFMMTAVAASASQQNLAAGGAFNLNNQPEFISIYDAANTKNLMLNPPVQISLWNDNLASCMTLPEYVMWEPNSVIGASWTGINNSGVSGYKFLTLIGIEYGMKNNGAG